MINRLLRAIHRTKVKEIKRRRVSMARQYNEGQQRFAQSGKVEERAREAEEALDGPEKEAFQQAEAVGKRHSAGEDPAVKSSSTAATRSPMSKNPWIRLMFDTWSLGLETSAVIAHNEARYGGRGGGEEGAPHGG
jgi:hypothetical protein